MLSATLLAAPCWTGPCWSQDLVIVILSLGPGSDRRVLSEQTLFPLLREWMSWRLQWEQLLVRPGSSLWAFCLRDLGWDSKLLAKRHFWGERGCAGNLYAPSLLSTPPLQEAKHWITRNLDTLRNGQKLPKFSPKHSNISQNLYIYMCAVELKTGPIFCLFIS